MALSTVDVGTTANDGTGDPLRTAFQTVNTAITAVNNAVVVGTGKTTFKDDSGSAGVSVLSSGFVGVGTTSPAVALQVNAATAATDAIRLSNSADSARLHVFCGEIQTHNGQFTLNAKDGFGLTFKTTNTDRAAITSGGDFTWKNAGATTGMTWDASANSNAGGLGIGTATPSAALHVAGNAYVTTTLGVGATPKTWSANWRGLQVGTGASFAGLVANNNAYVLSNLYVGGSGVQYNNDGTAGQLNIAGNQLIFSAAPTGVADAVATLTEAFRVNTSGDFTWQNAGGSTGMIWDASTDSNAGGLGIRTATPTGALDVNDDTIRVRTAKTPASASATGNAGDICWDASYIYVCTATNTWKRAAITTW